MLTAQDCGSFDCSVQRRFWEEPGISESDVYPVHLDRLKPRSVKKMAGDALLGSLYWLASVPLLRFSTPACLAAFMSLLAN